MIRNVNKFEEAESAVRILNKGDASYTKRFLPRYLR